MYNANAIRYYSQLCREVRQGVSTHLTTREVEGLLRNYGVEKPVSSNYDLGLARRNGGRLSADLTHNPDAISKALSAPAKARLKSLGRAAAAPQAYAVVSRAAAHGVHLDLATASRLLHAHPKLLKLPNADFMRLVAPNIPLGKNALKSAGTAMKAGAFMKQLNGEREDPDCTRDLASYTSDGAREALKLRKSTAGVRKQAVRAASRYHRMNSLTRIRSGHGTQLDFTERNARRVIRKVSHKMDRLARSRVTVTRNGISLGKPQSSAWTMKILAKRARTAAGRFLNRFTVVRAVQTIRNAVLKLLHDTVGRVFEEVASFFTAIIVPVLSVLVIFVVIIAVIISALSTYMQNQANFQGWYSPEMPVYDSIGDLMTQLETTYQNDLTEYCQINNLGLPDDMTIDWNQVYSLYSVTANYYGQGAVLAGDLLYETRMLNNDTRLDPTKFGTDEYRALNGGVGHFTQLNMTGSDTSMNDIEWNSSSLALFLFCFYSEYYDLRAYDPETRTQGTELGAGCSWGDVSNFVERGLPLGVVPERNATQTIDAPSQTVRAFYRVNRYGTVDKYVNGVWTATGKSLQEIESVTGLELTNYMSIGDTGYISPSSPFYKRFTEDSVEGQFGLDDCIICQQNKAYQNAINNGHYQAATHMPHTVQHTHATSCPLYFDASEQLDASQIVINSTVSKTVHRTAAEALTYLHGIMCKETDNVNGADCTISTSLRTLLAQLFIRASTDPTGYNYFDDGIWCNVGLYKATVDPYVTSWNATEWGGMLLESYPIHTLYDQMVQDLANLDSHPTYFSYSNGDWTQGTAPIDGSEYSIQLPPLLFNSGHADIVGGNFTDTTGYGTTDCLALYGSLGSEQYAVYDDAVTILNTRRMLALGGGLKGIWQQHVQLTALGITYAMTAPESESDIVSNTAQGNFPYNFTNANYNGLDDHAYLTVYQALADKYDPYFDSDAPNVGREVWHVLSPHFQSTGTSHGSWYPRLSDTGNLAPGSDTTGLDTGVSLDEEGNVQTQVVSNLFDSGSGFGIAFGSSWGHEGSGTSSGGNAWCDRWVTYLMATCGAYMGKACTVEGGWDNATYYSESYNVLNYLSDFRMEGCTNQVNNYWIPKGKFYAVSSLPEASRYAELKGVQVGDLLYFNGDGSDGNPNPMLNSDGQLFCTHVAVVAYISGDKIYTLEGNMSNHVGINCYSMHAKNMTGTDRSYIVGYARPL